MGFLQSGGLNECDCDIFVGESSLQTLIQPQGSNLVVNLAITRFVASFAASFAARFVKARTLQSSDHFTDLIRLRAVRCIVIVRCPVSRSSDAKRLRHTKFVEYKS